MKDPNSGDAENKFLRKQFTEKLYRRSGENKEFRRLLVTVVVRLWDLDLEYNFMGGKSYEKLEAFFDKELPEILDALEMEIDFDYSNELEVEEKENERS